MTPGGFILQGQNVTGITLTRVTLHPTVVHHTLSCEVAGNEQMVLRTAHLQSCCGQSVLLMRLPFQNLMSFCQLIVHWKPFPPQPIFCHLYTHYLCWLCSAASWALMNHASGFQASLPPQPQLKRFFPSDVCSYCWKRESPVMYLSVPWWSLALYHYPWCISLTFVLYPAGLPSPGHPQCDGGQQEGTHPVLVRIRSGQVQCHQAHLHCPPIQMLGYVSPM